MSAFRGATESTRRLLLRAVSTAKAGENKSAKRMLERVLHLPSTQDQMSEANYWLGEISTNKQKRIDYYKQSLAYNPAQHRARKKLAVLRGKLSEDQIIDPNQEIIRSPGTQNLGAKENDCKNCGGQLFFSPDGSKLVCEHCDSKAFSENKILEEENDFVSGIYTQRGHSTPTLSKTFDCKNCGTTYLVSEGELSLTCAYCDTAYTIDKTKEVELIPPDGIIFFNINSVDAEVSILKWLTRNGVQKPIHIEKVKAVYYPVWSFDIGGAVRWSGQEYDNNSESWVKINGEKYLDFDDLFVPGATNKPYGLKRLLPGFYSIPITEYKPEFLTNSFAEIYTEKLSDAAIDSRAIAVRKANREVKKNIFGNVKNVNVNPIDLILFSYKLIMVPLYVGKYVKDGKEFSLLMNGNSGEIIADLPPTRLQKIASWLMG